MTVGRDGDPDAHTVTVLSQVALRATRPPVTSTNADGVAPSTVR